MALGNCYTCIKYLMFAFNFVFWLLGCAILGVGIWLRADDSAADFLKESSKIDTFYALAYVMIAIGFIIMLIGFLGCCGAIRESQCMLGAFFVFLFIIFAILLGFGIWAAAAKDSFREYTEDMLEEGVNNYYKDDKQRAFMDSTQNYFKCCGWNLGAADYERGVDKGAPTSCHSDAYFKPCNDAFYGWVENRLVVIAAVAISVAVVLSVDAAIQFNPTCTSELSASL
ncbi:tetraspanin [Elysia marginata]|uniref:Tetraspanin n=1 Tax=Elysia marginata TaxID=1093978 RepID=A0AAV4J5E6_9GAST|nr:tetraspanin [Elysia marginata]